MFSRLNNVINAYQFCANNRSTFRISYLHLKLFKMLHTKPDTLKMNKYFEDRFKVSAVEYVAKLLVWEST